MSNIKTTLKNLLHIIIVIIKIQNIKNLGVFLKHLRDLRWIIKYTKAYQYIVLDKKIKI